MPTRYLLFELDRIWNLRLCFISKITAQSMLRFRLDERCAGIDYRFIKIRIDNQDEKWESRNQYSLLRPAWFGPLTATGHCKKCNANKYFSFCVPLQKDTSWGWENDIFILGWTLTLMSSNMLTVIEKGCRESLTVILHFYECWIKHRNSGITVHALKVLRVPVTFHRTITKLLFLLFFSFYFFPCDSQMFGCWDWEEETGSDCEKEITDAG